MSPPGRPWRSLVAALAVSLAVASTAPPVGATEPADDGVTLALVPDGDGIGLRWSTPAGPGEGDVELGPVPTAALTWDLTGLDRSAYRSDLVRIELVGADGPDAMAVTTAATHGRRAVVLDGHEGGSAVVQVGRRTVHRFEAGRHRHTVRLRASIPLATGGTAAVTTTLHIGVGGTRDGSSPGGSEDGARARSDDEDAPGVRITTELADEAEDPGPDDVTPDDDPRGPDGADRAGGVGSGPTGAGPRSPLAHTGAELWWAVAAGVVLLLLGAAALLPAHRSLRKNENHS